MSMSTTVTVFLTSFTTMSVIPLAMFKMFAFVSHFAAFHMFSTFMSKPSALYSTMFFTRSENASRVFMTFPARLFSPPTMETSIKTLLEARFVRLNKNTDSRS